MNVKRKGFRDIIAWQKAFVLTIEVYKSLEQCRDYSYRDQIQRASVSIMNNIAEGSARQSDKAFCNYLSIAKGSCAEVESMLLLGSELGYFTSPNHEKLIEQCDQTARLLHGLMKKLKAQDS